MILVSVTVNDPGVTSLTCAVTKAIRNITPPKTYKCQHKKHSRVREYLLKLRWRNPKRQPWPAEFPVHRYKCIAIETSQICIFWAQQTLTQTIRDHIAHTRLLILFLFINKHYNSQCYSNCLTVMLQKSMCKQFVFKWLWQVLDMVKLTE
jgi:hypothetical protein